MGNIDQQKIEDYVRGKMNPDERQHFEDALAADPELRRQTNEIRQLALGIQQVAQADIRRRAEAVRDKIKQEETSPGQLPQGSKPFSWRIIFELVLVFSLLRISYIHFYKEKNLSQQKRTQESIDSAIIVPDTFTDPPLPVALERFEMIFFDELPGAGPNKIKITVRIDANIKVPGRPVYALNADLGELSFYIHPEEDKFWKKPLELIQDNSNYYLIVDEQKILLIADGEDHDLMLNSSDK